jgi:hypothetical protein
MMNSNLNLAKLPECVCEMRYIDSALLTPCAEYQRVLRTRKVEEISATFSEYVANEPRVSYRDCSVTRFLRNSDRIIEKK